MGRKDKMDKKDKIDLCLKQAELAGSRWDRRRDYEWKVALLFWGGLLAASKFIREADVYIPFVFLCVGGILFVLIYTFVWLRGIWIANYNDKAWEFFFRSQAAKLLSSDSDEVSTAPPKAKPPLRQFLKDYSMIFQAVMTALITFAAIAIIGSKTTPNKQSLLQEPNTVLTKPETKPSE